MTHEAGIKAAFNIFDNAGSQQDDADIELAIQAYLSASGMVLVQREEIPLHDRPTPKDYADRVQASELDCKEARRRHGINGTGPCQRCGFGTCQVYV